MSPELVGAQRNAELIVATSHNRSPQWMLAKAILLIVQHLAKDNS